MKAQWKSAAFGLAAILVVASAHAGHGNQGGNKNSGGNQFRVQNNNFGGNNGGLKLTPSFNSQSSGIARNTGIVPKIGGQTFKPQILNQNNGGQNGLGIKLGPQITPQIKKIGLNEPKLNIGIKPADLGLKTGIKPLDPGFGKPAKPIGIGVIANGNQNGNKNGNVQNSKKINGTNLGLGIGLGVVKNLMGGNNHHHHCHDFCQPNYCWPSSCVTIDCCHYHPCSVPVYCLPPVTVVEVVTVIELPVMVDPMVIAPPQPEVDPTAFVTATDAAAGQPAADASLIAPATTDLPPAAPQGEDLTRSLTETPVSTTTAAPVEDANLVKIQVGSQVELKGKDLGIEAGQVVVQVGDLMLPATMKEWKNDLVKAELPRIGVVNPTKAFLHVVKPDGKFASSLPCMLIAPPQPAK